MTNKFLLLMILLSICFLPSCSPKIQHADSFYNYNDSDFPRDHLPIINPVEATRDRPNYPWGMKLLNGLHIDLPKSQEQEVQEVYGLSIDTRECSTHIHPHCTSNLRQHCATFATGLVVKRVIC